MDRQNHGETELGVAVADAWRRIDGYLGEHFPAVLAGLGGPASRAEIATAEAALGFALPADFTASLAVHRSVQVDGALNSYVRHGDIDELVTWRDEMVQEYTSGSDRPDDEIRRDQEWRRGWIPLDTEGDGSTVILDLDPGPDGASGQLIYADQGSVNRVLQRSWLRVLRDFAEQLEADRYSYDPSGPWLEERSSNC